MKYSKAVYVTSDNIKGNLNREYDVFTSRIVKNEKDNLETNNASIDFACQYDNNICKYDVYTNRVVKNDKGYFETNNASKDFACQYDSNIDTVIICTCKRTKRDGYRYFNTSRQVFTSQRYTSARGFTDVGVGSVKTAPRKRERKIYLPDTEDRGVGSSDLTSFIQRTRNRPSSYYDQKKTSSKCVGGVMEFNNIPVTSEKLSPICKTKSGSTSPQRTSFEEKINNDNHIIPDPVVNLVMGKKRVREDNIKKEQGITRPQETLAHNKHVDKRNEIPLPINSKIKSAPVVSVNEEKDFSSDSLVQHVHNLENPSSLKHSQTSTDGIIENKLEMEYIKMFSQISKQGKPIAEVHPVQDCTSASLRRRFEALRRGLSKKEVSVEHGIVIKSSSQNSVLSTKDVSIASDPPSLEARSYTVPSPLYKYQDVAQSSYRKSVTGKSHWSTEVVDSDCQNVKGMFKLWGKKFDFEKDCYNKTSPYTMPDTTIKQKKKVELILPKEEVIETQKKEGKKFSFFKRRNKQKAKQPYKSKKSVTAGRCEVGDGLMIRIGAANEFTPEDGRKKSEQAPDGYDDLLRKAWLKKCVDNRDDSQNSVKIRWNNEMYTTSSSTVFELMECIYKNTGILFSSKSEMTATTIPTSTTVEIPYYYAHKNQQVNFMQQTIQAWMIPKLITDNSGNTPKLKNKNNIEVSFYNQKWLIDKSKAFSKKIELVLHSKNFVKDEAPKSSEYIVIDIPKGYFLETSSEDEKSQSSDEQVFNIVEYETAKSISYLNKKRNDTKMGTGDHENDVRVTANVNQYEDKELNVPVKEIKTPLLHRDVLVQGSKVYIPKRCDVISVGIITQHTHNGDVQKPISLTMQDEMTDDDSTNTISPLKKCELAESYLQDYYRHWMPLGMDLYSWCISDSNLRASSDNNSMNSCNNQGDCSKSCPNICDDYQASAIVSSCTTSSHSQCMNVEESKADDTTTTYFNKLKKKKNERQPAGAEGKRVLPKDSVEVFKRRKIYAASKVKADWCADQGLEPISKPSIQDKFAQNLSNESICDLGNQQTKKKIKKHVSLKDFKRIGESIMSFKGSSRCKKCNKKELCSKHALVMPEPMCEMLPPACIDSCTKKRKPPCSKQGSPTCLVPPPPICPEGPPSPCQPACPPIPPPCASYLEGSSPSPPTLPPRSTSSSFSRFLPCLKKHSPLSSQQNPPSPPLSPHTSPHHLPPTSKPRTFSKFLSRLSRQKNPCIDTCSKQKERPYSTKDSSPCALLPEARPPSLPGSPPHRTKFTSPSFQQEPPCKDSHSNLKKPPCSKKDSSPSASLQEASPPSPPRSPHLSKPRPPTRTKFPLQSSQEKPPCKDSCSKLKKPPCPTKDSSTRASHPEASSPSPLQALDPCPPHRSKLSSPSSHKKAPCLESGTREKIPPCESKKIKCSCNLHTGGLPSIPRTHLTPTKSAPLRPPPNFPPPQSTQPCGCNSQKWCGLPPCGSNKKSQPFSQKIPCPPKDQLSPKNSGISLKNSPSNKYSEVFKRLIKKCNSTTTKKESGDCDLDCPRKAKQKKKEGSIPSIQLIPPLPFCQPSTPNPRSQSKISGLHLRKLPMPRNSSNESKPSCNIIKLNSKENITIRMKPKTPSTEAIRENCNIKVQDEDGLTLYERREYKMDTAQARKHLVQDMYRDSRIHRVSTSKVDIMNEKNLEFSESKSNTSLSNIVEINLNLKFKQADKTTDVNLKKCCDTPNDTQNEKVSSQASKDVYVLKDKTNESIDQIADAESKDVNIKIIISSNQKNSSTSKRRIKHPNLRADDDFSRKISEKFHTVSTGYSDVLDQQTYSIHRTTVNFTDSADTSKHFVNPSEELVTEELTEKSLIKTENEFVTNRSKSDHSVTFLTANNTDKVDSQVLPRYISKTKYSKMNLDNTADTFDEKSATDSENALLSDVKQSNVKIPKIRNKKDKKKMLKLIFEDSINSKNNPNKSKMRKIRKMLKAVLTSDFSGCEDDPIANELAYEFLKPNFVKDSESMTNYYQIDSSISDNRSSVNEIEEILHPTEINSTLDSAESTNEKSRCLCTHLAAKLNIFENNNFKACCCRSNDKRDEEIDCNLIEDVKANKAKYIDVETQDSNLKGKMKKSSVTIGSNTRVRHPQEVEDKKPHKLFSKIPKRLFSYTSSVKISRRNRQTALGLSDDDKVIFLNSESDESMSKEDVCMNSSKLNPIDILQLYETKKAVLEIYAEKPGSEEHLTAKLPKFVYKTDSEICNYEKIFMNSDFHEFSADLISI